MLSSKHYSKAETTLHSLHSTKLQGTHLHFQSSTEPTYPTVPKIPGLSPTAEKFYSYHSPTAQTVQFLKVK